MIEDRRHVILTNRNTRKQPDTVYFGTDMVSTREEARGPCGLKDRTPHSLTEGTTE